MTVMNEISGWSFKYVEEVMDEDKGEVPDIVLKVIFIDAKAKANFLEDFGLNPSTKFVAAQDLFDNVD